MHVSQFEQHPKRIGRYLHDHNLYFIEFIMHIDMMRAVIFIAILNTHQYDVCINLGININNNRYMSVFHSRVRHHRCRLFYLHRRRIKEMNVDERLNACFAFDNFKSI